MRLKKLQVSGFKSFVDSTDIRLPSHLVGVVGPNGCGKSNVIDAVRWVMGESSAKMLRGDSMADVIFNGSSARKPVGKASVELVFDNNDGRAEGTYAQFAEISVKRTLTRDGISSYSINNLKTRRKDVLDLFRGTGLGPRSYSIIEQGMVSRIVEARPEDLRVFVEEAAGTSKYKDRRRETETRIGHTRENLDRVSDIRDELGKQLRRLKRQSSSARRYKVLKDEERMVTGQLLVLRLNAMNQQLQDQDRTYARHENDLESALAVQRATESELESVRKQQSEVQERNSQIQQEFYQVGAEITRIEQQISHLNENQQRRDEEVKRLVADKKSKQEEIEINTRDGLELKELLDQMMPEFNQLQEEYQRSENSLQESEKVLQDWLAEMEAFGEQSRAPSQQIEIQKSRIRHLEQNVNRAEGQKENLFSQIAEIKNYLASVDIESLKLGVTNHDREYQEAEHEYQKIEQEIKDNSNALQEKKSRYVEIKTALQEVVSRLESLQQIQKAAIGSDDQSIEQWMQDNQFSESQRLVESITVAEGWERAVDRAMEGFLKAICTDKMEFEQLRSRPDSAFSVVTPGNTITSSKRLDLPALADKVQTGFGNLSGLLSGIYVLEDLEDALNQQHRLQGRECIVTRNGDLVGANWVSFANSSQLETGILVREDEISQLQQRREEVSASLREIEEEVALLEHPRGEMQQRLDSQREALNHLRAKMTDLHNHFGREEARHQEASQQMVKLSGDAQALTEQIAVDRSEIENANTLLAAAREESGNLNAQREKLVQRKEVLNTEVVKNRNAVASARQNLHASELNKQKKETELEALRDNIKRLKQEIDQADSRLRQLTGSDQIPEQTIDDLQTSLQENLDLKIKIEDQFNQSRDESAKFENKINQVSSRRKEESDRVNEEREKLDQQKLLKQEILVRRDTLIETISEKGFDREKCLVDLPDTASVEEWQESLDEIERKIARIGPVNLVAIEEFEEESERMEYLDRQHADLSEALETLESVIRKIDRETRSRFRETFDKINAGFNEFFPKLFGGGKAELLLTSDDLLTTGISVMARPPGKRNSHIHLLSGGEKALTAVALLFSLFKLNPAPFCMLDEVDAPLDDANVDRYCETLKTLANFSQMIVITHNKITMESMDLLVGVTMAEAGVSRLVSVDIDQAVEMAAQ